MVVACCCVLLSLEVDHLESEHVSKPELCSTSKSDQAFVSKDSDASQVSAKNPFFRLAPFLVWWCCASVGIQIHMQPFRLPTDKAWG
jgi:hypothetical protein